MENLIKIKNHNVKIEDKEKEITLIQYVLIILIMLDRFWYKQSTSGNSC